MWVKYFTNIPTNSPSLLVLGIIEGIDEMQLLSKTNDKTVALSFCIKSADQIIR